MLTGRSCRNCPVFDSQRGIHKYPRQKRKNRYFIILHVLNVVICLFVLPVCLLGPWFQRFHLLTIEQRKPIEPGLSLWTKGSHGCTEACDSGGRRGRGVLPNEKVRDDSCLTYGYNFLTVKVAFRVHSK